MIIYNFITKRVVKALDNDFKAFPKKQYKNNKVPIELVSAIYSYEEKKYNIYYIIPIISTKTKYFLEYISKDYIVHIDGAAALIAFKNKLNINHFKSSFALNETNSKLFITTPTKSRYLFFKRLLTVLIPVYLVSWVVTILTLIDLKDKPKYLYQNYIGLVKVANSSLTIEVIITAMVIISVFTLCLYFAYIYFKNEERKLKELLKIGIK